MNNDRSLNQRWNMAVIELARPCRRRRSRAYTTTSNSASRVMITTRKSIHGFPHLSYNYGYGAPLGPSGCRSSAINLLALYRECRALIGFGSHSPLDLLKIVRSLATWLVNKLAAPSLPFRSAYEKDLDKVLYD